MKYAEAWVKYRENMVLNGTVFNMVEHANKYGGNHSETPKRFYEKVFKIPIHSI